MRIFSKPNRSRETLSPILQSHSCSKMATRLPNIVQPSAKMSQDGLQERLGTAKNIFIVFYEGFVIGHFFAKVGPKMQQKSRSCCPKRAKLPILEPSWPHMGHLDAILAPSWDHFLTILKPLEPS